MASRPATSGGGPVGGPKQGPGRAAPALHRAVQEPVTLHGRLTGPVEQSSKISNSAAPASDHDRGRPAAVRVSLWSTAFHGGHDLVYASTARSRSKIRQCCTAKGVFGDGSTRGSRSFASPARQRRPCVTKGLEREDRMIDLEARPALIYVPNPEELLEPSRASVLPSTTELHAAYRGDDDVEH